MMRQLRAGFFCFIFSGICLTVANGETVRLEKAKVYPHAGISISLPTSFRTQVLSTDFEIVRGMGFQGQSVTECITLSAFPVDLKETPESFSEMLGENLEKDIAVRKLKTIDKSTRNIAGLEFCVRKVSYRYRGSDIAALGGVFIRKSDDAKATSQIAYVLTVEIDKKQEHLMDGLFDTVAGSVKLVDIVRPVNLDVKKGSGFISDSEGSYGLRIPDGWTGQNNQLGVFAGVVDYGLDGSYSPAVQIVSVELSGELSAEQHGEAALKKEKEQGRLVEILERGSVDVAGLKGFQFVLQRKANIPETRPANSPVPPPVVEVRRLLNAGTDKPDVTRHYAIILTVINCNPSRAIEIMDGVMAGFSLARRP